MNSISSKLFISTLVVLASVSSFGFDVNDEESNSETLSDRAQIRMYPGGKDEQDLKVQPTLPLPSRTLEGFTLVDVPTPSESSETD